jgi:hypothetical protein
VPVAYLAGRELLSSRTGLLAALLFAFNPILVWHSQDARTHSLAVLLSGLSFLFFLRALREPRDRTLALWAGASALGLLTHYFVAFLVGAEAAWLLVAFRSRRAVWVASGAVAAVGVAAMTIALQQRANVNLTYDQYGGLTSRLVQAPAQVLVGEQPPLARTLATLAALLVIPGLVMLLSRATARERRAAAIPAAVAGLALATMVLAALAGADYVSARNTLPTLLPVVLALVCGFGAAAVSRTALAGLVGLLALWLSINVVTADVPKFQREDWRGAADTLGSADVERAIVVTPYAGRGPLKFYLRGSKRMRSSGARVEEIDLVGLPPLFRKVGQTPKPPRRASASLPSGFHLVERREARYYTVLRFRSRTAAVLDRRTLSPSHLGGGPPEILLQHRTG